MKLETCKYGHRWDPSLTDECPECLFVDNFRRQEAKTTVQLEKEDYDLLERLNNDGVERGYFRNADGSMGEMEGLVFNHGLPRLITCPNGHRYDPTLTPECPECAIMGLNLTWRN